MLTELLSELYHRLAGQPASQEIIGAIDRLREDYDLEDDAQVPSWLTDIFRLALEGREAERVYFDRIGSDADSFLSEVSALIPGWQHDDHGEHIAIKLPALDREIVLSREERAQDKACCAYAVHPLNRK